MGSRCGAAAGVAAEHGIPLLVISAGTRNHFALDAFGAYAAVVQSPAYRDDKRRPTTEMLPGLLAGQQGPRLVARAGDVTIEGPQAVLVSNNVYGMGDIAGLGRRARLDRGTLGMFAVTVSRAVQATGLLAGTHSRGLTRLAAPKVVVDTDASQIPVGVDGEALLLDTPCAAPSSRAPCGSGCPVTAPGCPIPSRSWTGTGCGRSPDCAIAREGRPSSITERDGDDRGHASRFSRSILPICSSR
jgi:hypothetical protein